MANSRFTVGLQLHSESCCTVLAPPSSPSPFLPAPSSPGSVLARPLLDPCSPALSSDLCVWSPAPSSPAVLRPRLLHPCACSVFACSILACAPSSP
eukprot:7389690-Prymnesium_polylepis.2